MRRMIAVSSFLVLLLFASGALAANGSDDNEDNKGGALELTGLTLNFSPSVAGQYIDGTDNNLQWYAIGTYHAGGSLFYATSAQQTSVWKKPRTSDQTFTDAKIPATKANSESEVQWTDEDWEK